jgi:hypothetical protein
MSEEVKAIFAIYKNMVKLNKYRFIYMTAYEIGVELQRITSVNLEYDDEKHLIEAIKRYSKKPY